MFRLASSTIGRLTDSGSSFELWDVFVRFRHYVWTGSTVVWQQFATELAPLLNLCENRDPAVSRQVENAIYSLSDVVTYLKSNVESLIDYRTWQRAGKAYLHWLRRIVNQPDSRPSNVQEPAYALE